MDGETTPTPRILVVDDDEAAADLFADILQDEYDVQTAYGGEAALSAIDDSIDLVLLDRRMPGMAGDAVLEAIREHGYDGGVVMVTALSPDFDVLDMDFDEYIVKPVRGVELRQTVSRLISLQSEESGPQRYSALVSKRYALESRHAKSELSASEEYRELVDEIASLRESIGTDTATQIEAEVSSAVFSARNESFDTP